MFGGDEGLLQEKLVWGVYREKDKEGILEDKMLILRPGG